MSSVPHPGCRKRPPFSDGQSVKLTNGTDLDGIFRKKMRQNLPMTDILNFYCEFSGLSVKRRHHLMLIFTLGNDILNIFKMPWWPFVKVKTKEEGRREIQFAAPTCN